MARRYFGTDGVRGIVGEFLTVDLVERLGKAAALWSGSGRVFVGRDTRGSGVDLEEAFARGVVEAGGTAVLGGGAPDPRRSRSSRSTSARDLGEPQPARVQRRQALHARRPQAH